MARQVGVAQKMFRALADAGVNILVITTSEIKISVLDRPVRSANGPAGGACGVRSGPDPNGNGGSRVACRRTASDRPAPWKSSAACKGWKT